MVISAPKYKINKRDVVLHERLQEAYDEGRLIVHTDFMRLNRTDSPVFSPWLNTIPLLTLLTLALLVLLFGGLLPGDRGVGVRRRDLCACDPPVDSANRTPQGDRPDDARCRILGTSVASWRDRLAIGCRSPRRLCGARR